jgi:formylglycine-generating enzyme required for sulfatase activity
MRGVLEVELERLGAVRFTPPPPAPAPSPAEAAAGAAAPAAQQDPFEEFRRVLRHSRLSLDGEEMTDDQRDAMCNIGESLGLTGGQAEDLIDEYHEEMANRQLAPTAPVKAGAAVRAPVAFVPPEPKAPVRKPTGAAAVNTSPMARLQERQTYPNFTTRQGIEMMLVTSGQFQMGSDAPDAAPNEQPVVPTTISCFYLSRFPITNAQYELFDPSHVSRRPPWANDHHPVVYVSSRDALNFCAWLSARDGHKYRLPTEAEWEYAARGTDNRVFPWGDRLDAGHYANFADARTRFPWSDPRIDDGFAESSPVGSFPRGASPFGVEDLAGNVYEWCADFFDVYRGAHRVNPRGPNHGTKRIYRGGSWKSRAASIRTSARAFNAPEYVANDVGFRVACDCEG